MTCSPASTAAGALERRLLDLALDEALLDRLDRAAQLVDPLDQLPGPLLELVGERLDEVRAAERIGRVGAAGLVREELLGPKRDLRGVLGRQGERLVEPVRVDRLRSAGTAERAWIATRTMLFSGCCAVSVEPPVWAWKRSACAFGFVAPKRSRMISPRAAAPPGTSRPPGRSGCAR